MDAISRNPMLPSPESQGTMYGLIVDDSELNCMILAEAIGSLDGCVPQYFTDPNAAFDFIRANSGEIGVVITDFDMPQLNGIQLMKLARAVCGFQHVPIVMITSNEAKNVRREALEAGATDFMNKPFEVFEIRARIGNLLALSHAHRRERQRAMTLAEEVEAAVAVVEAREREIVERLASATEQRDGDTSDHIQRVAAYTGLIARGLGLDIAYCRMLALASTMHDVGKIAVPDSILLKPGRLDPDERRIMEKHAQHGYQVLAESSSALIQLAAEIALTHHERWDGSGYPRQLAGTAIPLPGRITAVADVIDALLSDRPYKKAWSLAETKAHLLEERGRHFDPDCVAAIIDNWEQLELMLSAKKCSQNHRESLDSEVAT